MAITTGNPQSTRSTTNASSYTLASYNVASGSNRVLVVLVSLLRSNENGVTVDGVTFGGVSLTEGRIATGTSTSRSNYVGIWYLVNPSVSTASIVVTPSASMAGAIVGAITLYGVAQATSVGVTQSVSNTTNTVNLYTETGVTTGGMAIVAASANSNNGPTWELGDNPATEIYDLNDGNSSNEVAGAGGYVANAVLVSNLRAGSYALCSITPARHVGVMVEFLPASAAPQSITPSAGIATAQAFGSLGLGLNIAAVGAIASAGNVPSPTATPGPVAVAPGSVTSLESIGAATVGRGAVSVLPGSIASAGNVPSAVVTTGGVVVAPSSVATGQIVSTLTVGRGAVTVAPSALATAESVPGPVVGWGAVIVAPSSLATGESVPTPTVDQGGVTVVPSAIGSAENVSSATLATGAVAVAPSAVGSAESLGSPALGAGTTVAPNGVGSVESVPSPALATGGVVIAPNGIATVESIGAAVLSAGGGIVAGDIATAEAFGGAALAPGAVAITPVGITSDANVNGVTVSSGSATLAPNAIGGVESFGVPTLSGNRFTTTLNDSADDALEFSNGSMYLTTTSGNVNAAQPYAAFRFPDIPVPAGATAIHTYLQLFTFLYDDPILTAKLELSASPAALSATAGDISGRTLTENGAVWSASNIGLNQYNQSPDLAAAFQEVLSLPGWTEGVSDILIVLHDNGAGGLFRFNMADSATDRPRLVIDYVIGATAQTVTVEGIPSGEAHGEAAVAPGATTVDVVNGVATQEIVADPFLTTTQTVAEAGEIASAFRSVGAVVAVGGPVVSAEAIPSGEVFGGVAVIVEFEITVTDGVATAESVAAPGVQIGAITILPGGVSSNETFGPAGLTTWVAVTPAAIASGESVGAASVIPGGVVIVAGSVAGAGAFGAALVTAGTLLVAPDGVPSVESVGAAVLTPGAVDVTPSGVVSAESVGAVTLSGVVGVTVGASVVSAESVGAATVVPGAAGIAPNGVGSLEAVGAPGLSAVATVAPDGIPSGEGVGLAALVPGGVALSPDGIASLESIGLSLIGRGAIVVTPAAVASVEMFGSAALTVGPVAIGPLGIPSGEAFGWLVLVARFLPSLNIYRVAAGNRVYRVAAEGQVYAVPFKRRVYHVED